MISYQLMKHQSEAVSFAVANRGVCAFFHEVGVGKTLTALSTFLELKKSNPSLKLLVICPLSLIYGAWTREVEKFTSLSWHDLHGNKGPNTADIFILNFEYLVSEKKFNALEKKLKASHEWLCVIDESSKMKNFKAKTVQRILELKNCFKHRVVMSGTPAPNIEWEYWSQMFFLYESIFGSNFYKFKNTYFAFRRGKQSLPPGTILNAAMIRKLHEQGFKYEILPNRREELFSRMRPFCHYVKAKDCIDLPEEVDEFRSIVLTDKQRKIYKQMEKCYIAELVESGTFAVANIALTKLMKLRQITSGFVINDLNEPVALIEGSNPKLDELVELQEECGQEQMIVWGNFHWEMEMIIKALKPYGGVSRLYGEVPYSVRNEELNNFLNGTNRFLVANPHSAGHGLTLTNCHIQVFFSLDYSLEGYSQARGRVYRKGQNKRCLYFHLIAENTIDVDVLNIIQRKETAQDVAERYFKNASKTKTA